MINKISKYRDSIMGVAILWVVFHHSGINLPNPIFALKRSGFGGVDVFMFLSGLGCVVSLSNNSSIPEFYKRRFIRLYPHYIPMLIVYSIINPQGSSILEYIRIFLGNITGFSFWAMFDQKFNWYILAIPFFYFLTPIFFEILVAKKTPGMVILLITSMVASICFQGTDTSIAVSRFPIYIIGMIAGFKLIEYRKNPKKQPNNNMMILIYITGFFGLIGLVLMNRFKNSMPEGLYNVFWPFILITPAFICLCASLFGMLEKWKYGRGLTGVFSFLGKISLDLYLIHIVIFRKLGVLLENTYDTKSAHPLSLKNLIIWAVVIILTVVVSYGYYNVINKLVMPFTRNRRSNTIQAFRS